MDSDQKELQEQAKKIEEIYNEAIKKLEDLGTERKEIIRSYIKELEVQKVGAIRHHLDYKINENFMDNEKDLLKKDLSKLEKKEEIEKFVEDAELLGHEDIAQLGREKIDSLSKKAELVSETSPNQVEQAVKLGGSENVINERTEEVDKKITKTQTDSTQKIEEISKNKEGNMEKFPNAIKYIESNQKVIVPVNEVPPEIREQKGKYWKNALFVSDKLRFIDKDGNLVESDVDVTKISSMDNAGNWDPFMKELKSSGFYKESTENESPSQIIENYKQKIKPEKIKELDGEMENSLNKLLADLPEQMKELVDSEPYKRFSDLNEKRIVEEKALFEIYENYTKNDSSHHHSFSTGGLERKSNQYAEDLRFNNAPEDIIKRFTDFKDKYNRKTEKEAEEIFVATYNEKLRKAYWDFETQLFEKSKNLFEEEYNDQQSLNEFIVKYKNLYNQNFSRIQEETIPNKELDFSTAGTEYS